MADPRRQLTPTALLLGFLLVAGVLAGCDPKAPAAGDEVLPATIAGERFKLELALTPTQRLQGLSDRKEIARDGGMLFVFTDAAERQFVMRRCLVPIDIIFVGPGGRIVKMHEMKVEPPNTPEHELKRYSSVWPAQFAIELKDGSIKRLQLKEGQKLNLPWQQLVKLAK